MPALYVGIRRFLISRFHANNLGGLPWDTSKSRLIDIAPRCRVYFPDLEYLQDCFLGRAASRRPASRTAELKCVPFLRLTERTARTQLVRRARSCAVDALQSDLHFHRSWLGAH